MSLAIDTDSETIARLAATLTESLERSPNRLTKFTSPQQRVVVLYSSCTSASDWANWQTVVNGIRGHPQTVLALNYDRFVETFWCSHHGHHIVAASLPDEYYPAFALEPKNEPFRPFIGFAHRGSLADLATKMLEDGDIVGLLPTSASDDPEKAAITMVLEAIEEKIKSGETIDDLDEFLSTMLQEEKPTTGPLVLAWLNEKQRPPLVVWYLLDLLQRLKPEGLAALALDLLKQTHLSEATLGALQTLRRIPVRPDVQKTLQDWVLATLEQFAARSTTAEGSIDEKILSELIDATGACDSEKALLLLQSFLSRVWTFKVRVRAMAAIQFIITQHPDSSETEAFVRKTWGTLTEMILSLVESYNLSHTTRALLHKALELYVARLGPECENIPSILRRAPELREQLLRSIKLAQTSLVSTGKDTWLGRQSSAAKLQQLLD